MNTPQRQNCPDDEVLQELAAGIGSPELEQQAILHVAQCSECSAALRRYIREFSDEQTPENIALINKLQSSKPQWQKKLVRDRISGGRRFPWLKLVPAMAALAAVIFAVIQGPALLVDYKVKQAQNDIAATFSIRRTTEGRMPGVSYSKYNPRPIVLGAENGPGLDEIPASLHDAISAANQNLDKKADPRWLQIQGLGLLWEATPSSLENAEKYFERARSDGLLTPSLEIDLAASYYERDSRAEHPNLQRTLNLLSEVLSKPALSKEDQASALFNLALAYEKTQAWDLAVSTWEKYLQVDSTSDWTSEAQQHLKDAKAKISARPQQSYSDPSFFLQQKAQGNLRPEDPEQYQQKALSQWLPVAIADKESDAYRAVSGLADVFANGHSDPWMKDFIGSVRSSDMTGIKALNNAILDNERGLNEDAVMQSDIAARIFSVQKNLPGKLFSQFQAVYAKRSRLRSTECLIRAGPLWDELSATKYRWLQAQVALEKAQCRNFLGELDESDGDSKISLDLAQHWHLPVMELRVLGISASMHHQQGRCDGAWDEGVNGLRHYWEGSYPKDRIDQFYAVMWQCTEDSGALYATEAFLQHTLKLRVEAAQHNSFREAMLHLHLRNIFLSLRQSAAAESEEGKAESLLKNVKQADKMDPTEYKLVNDINPAELELQQGDSGQALVIIQRVGSQVKEIQNDFITLSVSRVSGDVYKQLGRFEEAKAAYQKAINIAEGALENLKDGEKRIEWLRATDQSYRGLVRVLLEQKKDEEALERWEWYQSRSLLEGLHVPEQQISILEENKKKETSTKQLHPSPETRLIYANFKDGLQIWTSKDGKIQGTWVKMEQQDFERAVRDFAERCSNPDSSLSDVRERGKWLYSQMLQPVVAWLPESEIVAVELDRSTYNLSIEALTSPAGWYFGEKYPVVYSPGIGLEEELRAPRPLSLKSNVALLDASHPPGSSFLPGMEAQRSAIIRMFPRAKIMDSSITSWKAMHSQLTSNEIFHYMGHGKREGNGTALVLNANESLRSKDIDSELFRHSDLVVLAACSTGRENKNGTLDASSLVRAFLIARVPIIIASHWDVDSETTSHLMIYFYENMSADKSIAYAIYHARKKILADRPHPYYWASFSLTGKEGSFNNE
jgi:CHAT domain-containing protein